MVTAGLPSLQSGIAWQGTAASTAINVAQAQTTQKHQ
jgi:hypothetical protein